MLVTRNALKKVQIGGRLKVATIKFRKQEHIEAFIQHLEESVQQRKIKIVYNRLDDLYLVRARKNSIPAWEDAVTKQRLPEVVETIRKARVVNK